jgi:hypothetical protein
MKKHLNATAVVNELKAGSVFFRTEPEKKKPKPQPVTPTSADSTAQPRESTRLLHASHPASTLASEQDSLLEEIRKIVKAQGKEVSYVRLTLEEKNRLDDIIYSYKRQGIRTSETEISRLAINYLIEDYKVNGKMSILARLIDMLNA